MSYPQSKQKHIRTLFPSLSKKPHNLLFVDSLYAPLSRNGSCTCAYGPRAIYQLTHFFLSLTHCFFRIGTLALGGTYAEFSSLSREQRTQIVLSWSNSMIRKLRIFSRALLALASISFYTQPIEKVQKAIGYPGPDPQMHSERFTSKTFPVYEFIKVPAEGLELTFDVVIVGSGAGGGVMAAELSQAGKRVLVIEKGHHYSQHELTLHQCDGLVNLYENGKLCSL